jgi:GDP-L-fucose synthase
MKKDSKIYIAGHRGMVGSAIFRQLENEGYSNIITRTHKELDLTRQEQVERFFEMEKPEYVFLAAARVGGIMANSTYKAEFFYDNTMIALNVIHAAYKNNVKKLMNLGSSCIFPKLAPQPLKEEYLLTGPLEESNDAYAVAKISAIKMCTFYNEQYGTNFLSVMPTNLYGAYDNFDLTSSHVLPAMIRKFHEAKIRETGDRKLETGGRKKGVELWGDGSPLREFLYADDLADAVIHLMKNKEASDIGEFVNIGTGKDLTIKELAETISEIIGYEGDVSWDTAKPNGTPRKLLDVSLLTRLGWQASTSLKDGIRKTYDWFKNQY